MAINRFSVLKIINDFGPGTSKELQTMAALKNFSSFGGYLYELDKLGLISKKPLKKSEINGTARYSYEITKSGLVELEKDNNRLKIQSIDEINVINSKKTKSESAINRDVSPLTKQRAKLLNNLLQQVDQLIELSKININNTLCNINTLNSEGIRVKIIYDDFGTPNFEFYDYEDY